MAGLGLQKLLGGSRRDAAGPQAEGLDARIRAAVSLLVSSPGRRRRLGLDRPRRRQRALRHVAGALGAEPGPEGRLQRARRQLPQGRRHGCRSRSPPRPRTITRARRFCCTRCRRSDKATSPWPTGCTASGCSSRPARWPIWPWPWSKWTASRWPASCSTCWPSAISTTFPSRRTAAEGSLPWSQSPAELHALWALASTGRRPNRRRRRNSSIGSWPIASAIAGRPTRPPAPPRWRCAAGSPRAASRASDTRLTVFVNDVLAKTLDVDPTAGTQTIDVPAKRAQEGRQAADQLPDRRPRALPYQCILGGFVPTEKLKGTTDEWTDQADVRAGAAGNGRPRSAARIRRRSKAPTPSSRIR